MCIHCTRDISRRLIIATVAVLVKSRPDYRLPPSTGTTLLLGTLLHQNLSMNSYRPVTTINTLPDDVFIDIFRLCRMDQLDRATESESRLPWKWHRLAHVCRTWRHIMFASSRHLRLELLCTHGTPVKKNLGYLPAFPITISFLDFDLKGQEGDQDNIFAALEHRDRVQVIEVGPAYPLMEELATAMQEPFPALTHLRFESEYVTMPCLPDTFLGGSAPRLQTIYMSRVPFPAAPTLLLSAHDLVDVHLSGITPTGYIPPEMMVTTLGALPRLKRLTFEFEVGMTYPDRMRLLPTTRIVLPALTTFYFKGLFEYFEDFVAQIDTPQLDCLQIEYLFHHEVSDFQLPQLREFFDRSENFRVSRFIRADLYIEPLIIAIKLVRRHQSFYLSVQQEAMGQVVNQLPLMHSNVVRLFIGSDYEDWEIGDYVQWLELQWLELLRPFASVRALNVSEELSWSIPLALKNVTEEMAAQVLPALKLLYLENQPAKTVKKFLAARQSMGRPVTFLNKKRESKEKL
ncbi:hypothetical protein EDB89DRAFT_816493 [Lactarius sanguifluus]|nr:hypothetical protein EDB89DRAFT_816493 [Lactarius sanguifluus]